MDDALKKEFADALFQLKRHRKPFPVHFGIAPVEFQVLGYINSYQETHPEGIKASTIGEIILMSRPAVSQMLNSLEKKQFIKRVMTEEDRRVVLVCITEKGEAVLQEAQKCFMSMLDRVYENFGEEDTRKFIDLLTRFHEVFNNEESYE